MSKKNSREEKKKRRVINSLANTPTSYIDLIQYVRDRTNCSASMAVEVLLAGALKVDSHPVGYKWEGPRKVLDPYLPAEYRDRIIVVMPKELKERRDADA
jgi:hypothetical protein